MLMGQFGNVYFGDHACTLAEALSHHTVNGCYCTGDWYGTANRTFAEQSMPLGVMTGASGPNRTMQTEHWYMHVAAVACWGVILLTTVGCDCHLHACP